MTQTCDLCGVLEGTVVDEKPVVLSPVVYPNNTVLDSAMVCPSCLKRAKAAAKVLNTGLEIVGPTLEQAIAGDFARLAAGQKDKTLEDRPFVNHSQTMLGQCHRRGWISDAAYLAGDKYRSVWLRAGLTSRVSAAYDGGSGGGECTYGMAAGEVVAHNRRLLRAARKALDEGIARKNVGRGAFARKAGPLRGVAVHDRFEQMAIYDVSRLDVGRGLVAATMSKATAIRAGKRFVDQALEVLVDHFRMEPRRFHGKASVARYEPSEEAREVARRHDEEEQARLAGEIIGDNPNAESN